MQLSTPTSSEQLKSFVTDRLGVQIPGRRACEHHVSPWDYISDAFFHGRDCVVWANRGGGKTMSAAVATVLDAVFRDETQIVVLGGSQDQSDRVAEYVRDLLRKLPGAVHKSTTRRRIRLCNGSTISMLAQSEKSVRGTHVQRIRCDELELFDEDVWRAVQFCTIGRNGRHGSLEVLSTAHRVGGRMDRLIGDSRQGSYPGKLYSWCLWEVIERCGDERKCDECLLKDDCGGAARQGVGYFSIDDAIAIKARSSKAAWESEMLCLGAAREHLVFPEFNAAKHVRTVEYCKEWPTFRAMDFGYRSPMVCLWVQLTAGGAVHVIDEYVRARLPLRHHARDIRARDKGPVTATFVDPAGRQRESTSGQACTEMLASCDIQCTSRGSTIAEGLELIRAALSPADGETSLLIAPRCRMLIEAMSTYHYPPPESDAPADRPVKDGPDHLVDALRYFFVNRLRPGIAIGRKGY